MFRKKNDLRTPMGLFGSTPGFIDILLVVVLCMAAFIFFDQWFDMTITSQHSSDLLTCIFTGKPLNFYTYVLDKASSNGYISPVLDETKTAAAYNIMAYITLAIWELPIYALNHIHTLSNYDVLLEVWARFLSIILTCICCFQITKLCGTLMTDKNKAKWAGYYFISSPLIVYCVIIRNQLDIIPVLLIILALRQFFQKKYTAFTLIMALAACFKIVPFLIVIPLLLLAEKRIGKLIKYIAFSISLYAVTNIIFIIAGPAYLQMQSLLNTDASISYYIFKQVIPGGVSDTSVFLLLYFLICVAAYLAKPTEKDFPIYTILLGFASISTFFLFVKWHPQWMVLLLPFITLIVFSLSDFLFGILLDMALTLGFLVTSILNHLTAMVFNSSIFYTITQGQYSGDNNFNPIYTYFADHKYTDIIPSTLFFAGIVSLLLVAVWNNRSRTVDIANSFDNDYKVIRGLLYARSAIILIVILPPVISYLSHPI